MSFKVIATFDTLRTLAFGSISGAYAAVGNPLTFPARWIRIVNATNGDMFFSTDGVNNMLFLPASTAEPYPITENRENPQNVFVLPIRTQFFVKQSTAPTSGAVYIEVLG